MPKKKAAQGDTTKARQKYRARPLSGFVAWQQAAKDLGLDVKLPRLGAARSEAYAEWKAALASKIVVERGSGKLLPAYQQKRAVKTGLAPLPPRNMQLRPCAKVARLIERVGRPVPPPPRVTTESLLGVEITPRGRPRDGSMVDWTAECALLQLHKAKGTIHRVRASAFEGAAHGQEVARLLLKDGSVGRPAEEAIVHVLGFSVAAGWAEQALQAFVSSGLRADFESNFHEKYHEHDERADEIRSTEFGYSGHAGRSSEEQAAAMDEGVPFTLKAWLDPRGQAWVAEFLMPVLPRMWELCKLHYPLACERMYDETIGGEWGMLGTGWNKVTVGVNNPTGMHFDDKNKYMTALLVVGLKGVKGGSHVLLGVDLGAAVVVEACEWGVLILGDYAAALHGNLATIAGTRFVVNAYCSANVVARISPH